MASSSALSADKRRTRQRESARRAILEAAEELLVAGGADALSMRRLAERCGYTAPTIYHYFRDKTTLVDELLEERLSELAAGLRAADRELDRAAGAEARLRRLSEAFARWGRRNPSHYQLLMTYRGPDAPRPPSTEEVEGLFLATLQELSLPGEADRETLRQALWSLVHGFILLQTTYPEEDWMPDLLDRSIEAMVRGWLARASVAGSAE